MCGHSAKTPENTEATQNQSSVLEAIVYVFTPPNKSADPSAQDVLGHMWVGGPWAGNTSGCTLALGWM